MAESALSKTKIGSMVMGEVHSLLADADPSSFMLLKAKAECFVYSKGAPLLLSAPGGRGCCGVPV